MTEGFDNLDGKDCPLWLVLLKSSLKDISLVQSHENNPLCCILESSLPYLSINLFNFYIQIYLEFVWCIILKE